MISHQTCLLLVLSSLIWWLQRSINQNSHYHHVYQYAQWLSLFTCLVVESMSGNSCLSDLHMFSQSTRAKIWHNLPKAWIDIGKSEIIPGVSYVALSRIKNWSFCALEPMTLQRLTSIKSSPNLQYRLSEEAKLDKTAYSRSYTFNSIL